MWITACVVLHNILLDQDNKWEKGEGQWTAAKANQHDEELLQLDRREREERGDKREEVKKIVLGIL